MPGCSVLRIRDAVQWWCLPGSLKPSMGALIWPSLAKMDSRRVLDTGTETEPRYEVTASTSP